MSGSYKPFFKVTWNTPDGKPPEKYRRKKKDESPQPDSQTPPPGEELSPPPPISPCIGESDDEVVKAESTQGVAGEEVANSASPEEAANFHQQHETAAESSEADSPPEGDIPAGDVSAEEATAWNEIAAALRDLIGDDSADEDEKEVVKVSRSNTQKLTPSEEDRFLMCLTYGLSMRQAAEAVGFHHTTMVKRAKRDKTFAALIAHARSKAKSDPLMEVQQASKKSWRAAAWLLTYLERRDSRGGKKAS